MKKFILLSFSAALLSGCSSWHGSGAHSATAKPIASVTNAALQKTSTAAAAAASTYIQAPNSEINFHQVWIDCDLSQEMVYVKQGNRIVRSMPTSSGLDTMPDNTTPRGTFYIQQERGLSFYAPQYEEGAKYWVSFKDHGVFLFHSVVFDKNGNIKQDELKKLGHKASHGCFRLPLDDAKWIYDNILTGTKVVIHD